ncbi:hypothetical protein Emed_001711 [Eimeria media]
MTRKADELNRKSLFQSFRRWILLTAFTLQTVATGCVYFGWAPLSHLLLNAGVFASKCAVDENGQYLVDRREDGHAYICNEQDAAVQHLYAITLAVHFTTSALAGLMMDTLGPKFTSVLGQGFNLTGWLLLSTVTPQSRARVYAGFVFIGMGADVAFLPTLLVSRLFPTCPGLVITLLGAASSASFMIPMILWSCLPTGNLSGCMWYAALGPGLFALVDAVLMPLRPFKPAEGSADAQRLADPAAMDEADAFVWLSQRQAYGSTTELVNLRSRKRPGENGSDQECSRSIFRSLLSERFLLIALYFIGVSWVSSFYQEAHSRMLSSGPQRFLGAVLPLSFIPCIFLGKCSDAVGILPVMMAVNTAGLLAYLCSLSQDAAAGYASVLFFMVYMSLFSSQIFIYINAAFNSQHFGRLVGLVEMTGGLLSLVCNPVYAHAVGSAEEDGILRVQVLVLLLLLLEFAVLGRLFYLGIPTKSLTRPTRHSEDLVPTQEEP